MDVDISVMSHAFDLLNVDISVMVHAFGLLSVDISVMRLAFSLLNVAHRVMDVANRVMDVADKLMNVADGMMNAISALLSMIGVPTTSTGDAPFFSRKGSNQSCVFWRPAPRQFLRRTPKPPTHNCAHRSSQASQKS